MLMPSTTVYPLFENTILDKKNRLELITEITVSEDGTTALIPPDLIATLCKTPDELPDVCLYILCNSIELMRNPNAFVDAITKLRELIGYHKLIYTPAIGSPEQLALLAYCSVDLVDSIPLILNAHRRYLVAGTTIRYQKPNMDFEHALAHNYHAALAELELIRTAILENKLREHVEARVHASSTQVAILRLLDHRYYSFIEGYTPIRRSSKLMAISMEALHRPEIVRFHKRLRERYIPPPSAKVLLLLPCSARKPYSSSKSHKLFRRAIFNSSSNPSVVHEVIITSPLGVVPRELELFYPAAQYDIPVTGLWYAEEKELIAINLEWLVQHGNYEVVISHMPQHLGLIDDVIDDVIYTTQEGKHPTERIAIEKLRSTLKAVTIKYPVVSNEIRNYEQYRAVALFQFGQAGEALTTDVIVKGDYPKWRIYKADTQIQIAMLDKTRGLLALTFAGGELLATAKTKGYFVNIDDFIPAGDVFAAGVNSADPNIRIGDEVIVVPECAPSEVRAVGVAKMSASEMVRASRGVAVKVRHRHKKLI
jgi:archaeosine synthase